MQTNKLLEDLYSCPICFNILTDPTTTRCGHTFCLICIYRSNSECAICRTKLTDSDLAPNYLLKENIEKLTKFNEENSRMAMANSFTSPNVTKTTCYRLSESYYKGQTMSNGTDMKVGRYRRKRKHYEMNNYSPMLYRSASAYSRASFVNNIVKDQFINKLLNDFKEAEDYDILKRPVNTSQNYNNEINTLQSNLYEIDLNEWGPFAKRFKYA
jgi:hypothetical protein